MRSCAKRAAASTRTNGKQLRVLAFALAVLAVGYAAGRLWPPSAESVAAFLEDHPQFLADRPQLYERSRPVLEARFKKEERQHRRNLIAAEWPAFLGSPNTPRLGSLSDPVVVVEFIDYACIPCKLSADRIENLVATNPDTQFVMAYMVGNGGGAELAARAALAIWKNFESEFPAFHREMMAAPVTQLSDLVTSWLHRPEYNSVDLIEEVGSEYVRSTLRRDRELFNAVGARAIPSYVVNGELLTGAVSNSELQQAIDRTRAAASSEESQSRP